MAMNQIEKSGLMHDVKRLQQTDYESIDIEQVMNNSDKIESNMNNVNLILILKIGMLKNKNRKKLIKWKEKTMILIWTIKIKIIIIAMKLK